jgi:hypothetical protein
MPISPSVVGIVKRSSDNCIQVQNFDGIIAWKLPHGRSRIRKDNINMNRGETDSEDGTWMQLRTVSSGALYQWLVS